MPDGFDRDFWEERYRGHGGRPGAPSPHLIEVAGGLAPGTALEAGCGEGAEALWLAGRGWDVTAVDIAQAALDRARSSAEAAGELTGRITWRRADLTDWSPPEGRFDLISSHYVHPSGPMAELVHRLAAGVVRGGTLLVVGHDPADEHSAAHGGPDVALAADVAAGLLDPTQWDVEVAESRERSGPGQQPGHHPGRHRHGPVLRDVVLVARRR